MAGGAPETRHLSCARVASGNGATRTQGALFSHTPLQRRATARPVRVTRISKGSSSEELSRIIGQLVISLQGPKNLTECPRLPLSTTQATIRSQDRPVLTWGASPSIMVQRENISSSVIRSTLALW